MDPDQNRLEIDPFRHQPPFDWRALFGNDHPVDIEIGCGKGRFLAAIAERSPARNFLGAERAARFYRKAVARVRHRGVRNVRLMRADGLDLLDRWVPPASVQRIHLYFPDPWPKKRHHKRRIVRPALLQLAARAVPPGGEFRVATDHPEYRQVIREQFAAHAEFFAPRPWSAEDPERLPTSYSEKWQRAGRALWWARYHRTSAPARPTSPLDAFQRDATFPTAHGAGD
ncbi:MAG: tRNA (guanosine(46)-N7)-methyltransferase TrmB [Candidatus Eisenbacteria bacterium]|nr:tRNA (guanosine(46)-N7)-methyltransferase TrmB [Candidatus Eisenbacteria bacterium]